MTDENCDICNAREGKIAERDFFSGKRSPKLIATDLKTNESAVIFHVKHHTYEGQFAQEYVKNRDEYLRKQIENTIELQIDDVVSIVTNLYRDIAYISADLVNRYMQLDNDVDLKIRVGLAEKIDRSLKSLNDNIPFANQNVMRVLEEDRKKINKNKPLKLYDFDESEYPVENNGEN